MLGWLMPDRGRRLRRLERFFALELRHVVLPAGGRAWTLDGCPGAPLELPPNAWHMPIRAQLAHGPSFTRVFGSRLLHAFGLITKMERRHLREPHFYIPYVGVAPAPKAKASAPRSCTRPWTAATVSGSPPTSKRPANATPRSTSASASRTSARSAFAGARRCGPCDGRRAGLDVLLADLLNGFSG